MMRIWDIENGHETRVGGKSVIMCKRAVWSVRYSPDGKFIATAGDHRLKLRNSRNHELVDKVQNCFLDKSISWAPNGKSLATSSCEGKICVRDVNKLKLPVHP
ncbi:hypothetical protein CONPUDRAFT_168609 [Coniophora puteana RWD-64-598 SS2]|uniref:WD40 repeat-like protein n=1 Tax=Coniophora puteana (strain RWD-64-598) TaxID=741705 RepID=A0A5M3ME34_CONPW|nr:uncharacterized protein CONPUDRAFT_168609 [Coniophora puteana RWD-64-598 SS2]EIW76875.1 hypothetical protein CONPUDRAFT_168609 [Coniophora puteana RWD-64-598 SS2]